MNSRTAVTAGALALLLALGACSEDDVDSATPSQTAPGQTDTASAGEGGEGPALPSPTPVFSDEEAVLDVAVQTPRTLDPMRIRDPGSVLVVRQLFEGLTSWNSLEDEVVPAAAVSWKVSDGGRRFAFSLRAGMTFHDGTSVTSRDFAFAFDRIAAKKSASDLAYTLEKVEGFAVTNQLGEADQLSGISTPDDLTLVIQLTEPFYDFPVVLTHPGLVPVPKDAVRDGSTFITSPIGNGPFQMAQAWRPGDPVFLRAFLGFYDTPELDGIRFLPFPDAAASWLQFVDGRLDIAEVPAGQVEGAEDAFGDRGFQSFLASYYYGFNLKMEQLKKPALRRAISRAIDRETIARTIYRDTLQPPRGIVPEGMTAFEENICLKLCSYSPEIARAMVARLPERKRRLTLEFNRGEPHGSVARAIKQDLERVGFEVRTKAYGFRDYLKRLRNGRQGPYRFGWIAEYPSPDVFLSGLFASNSPDNHSGFSSVRVDALLARAHRTRSDGKRVQLYKQAEELILREAPVIPIGSFVTHWAAQQSVQGIVFDEVGGFDANNVDIIAEEE